MEDREVLLGHANHSMAGHYASADVGRLLKQVNLILNREETRTVLASRMRKRAWGLLFYTLFSQRVPKKSPCAGIDEASEIQVHR
jgi:hypothetical protein